MWGKGKQSSLDRQTNRVLCRVTWTWQQATRMKLEIPCERTQVGGVYFAVRRIVTNQPDSFVVYPQFLQHGKFAIKQKTKLLTLQINIFEKCLLSEFLNLICWSGLMR